MFVLREAAKAMNMDIKKMRIAIQGFGNAGMFALELSQQLGAKVVAISDSKGGVYSESGLDLKKLSDAKLKHRLGPGLRRGWGAEDDEREAAGARTWTC